MDIGIECMRASAGFFLQQSHNCVPHRNSIDARIASNKLARTSLCIQVISFSRVGMGSPCLKTKSLVLRGYAIVSLGTGVKDN
jgi:hypothetical protein